MDFAIQHRAFVMLQENKFLEAIALLDASNLFDEDVNDVEVLKLFNNYLIACLHSNEYVKGLEAIEKLHNAAPLNPHIYHNAACLYCKSGELTLAIAQVRLARKFGGSMLVKCLMNDVDLAPIAGHLDFIDVITPLKRKYEPQILTIPFEGINHFQFDELGKDEMVSLFFIFRSAFDDMRKKSIASMINTMTRGEEWTDRLVENTIKYYGWRDGTVIGKDFITLHIKDIWQPKYLMLEIYNLVQSFDEQLVECFFVKRELAGMYFGTTALSVTESSLAAAFAVVHSEMEFWKCSFSYADTYPSPEYPGKLKCYGHHDGSETIELRSLVYDPFFRISYGLVKADIIKDNERSINIFQFIQDELSKYFEDEIPTISNTAGELKVDRITAHGRIGYALEITNDEILECFYTRYAFRIKEVEIFKALKDTIFQFKLSPVIHWHRNLVYTFHLWESMEDV
jgi:hypothetical protein